MKKQWLKVLSLALALVLLVGVSAVLASSGQVSKLLEYMDIKLTLNGETLSTTDVNGNPVEAFVIDGTTYAPVRALGEAFGYQVSWDAENNEVVLNAPTTLVVGTFNIDVKSKENLISDQRNLLAGYGVEVFGVQEVDVGLPRYDVTSYDPFDDFAVTPYVDSFFGQSVSKGENSGYGNGIVSAYPLTSSSVTELYGAAQAPEEYQAQLLDIYSRWEESNAEWMAEVKALWGSEGAIAKGAIEPRSYSRAVLEKDGQQVAFYSVHLTVESADVRAQQLIELKAALDADPVAYKILVGDFNADQGIHEYDIFTNDGYSTANGFNGVWYNTIGEDEVAREGLGLETATCYVDNIIVSDNITINYVQMIQTDLSDHNPLVAGLTLN